MSTEALKEQARRHEQKEEWRQALDLYQRVVDQLGRDDQIDIGLHNRLGDLAVRVGDLEQAVRHYERAVDLYVEAELPNNAIAVCKKIIRSVPGRTPVYLTMARVRAHQGFAPDARQNLALYFARLPAGGDVHGALRAVEELVETFPDESDLRLFLAEQLARNGRATEAVDHLRHVHDLLTGQGLDDRARAVEAMAREMDPSVELAAPDGSVGAELDAATLMPEAFGAFAGAEAFDDPDDLEGGGGWAESSFLEIGETVVDWDDDVDPLPVLDDAHAPWDDRETIAPAVGEEEDARGGFYLPEATGDDAEPESIPAHAPVSGSDLEIPDPDALLPFMSEADLMSFDLPEPDASRTANATGVVDDLLAAGDLDGAERRLREMRAREPLSVAHCQRLVELAYRRGDVRAQAEAYVTLARCLEANGSGAGALSVYRQVLALDPSHDVAGAALADAEAPRTVEAATFASSEHYVDLGSLILDDLDEEKTTRFRVAYDEPTGDEKVDFDRTLDQFKASVAQNIDADDVRSHHDLGAAYKEMGLLDEAIEQFQTALRAARDHLPTYELLGQCFIETGRHEAAVNVLNRALRLPVEIEDELVGIYYYLGRAHEQAGDRPGALEFYDRVFSLDINFMDVTERLRALR